MRPLCSSVLVVSLLTFGTAAEPSSAERDYTEAVAKAKRDYDKAMTAARDKFRADLRLAMAEETKKGNLDVALDLRDKLKSLDAASPDLPPLLAKLAGTRWKTDKGFTYAWDSDGTVQLGGDAAKASAGKKNCLVEGQTVVVPISQTYFHMLKFDASTSQFEVWLGKTNNLGPPASGAVGVGKPEAKAK